MKNKPRGNEAEMANIARSKAKCYISIEAECFIFRIARARQCFNCYREFLYKFAHHHETSHFYQCFSRTVQLLMYPSVSYCLLLCLSVYTAKTRGVKSSIFIDYTFPVL